MTKARSAPRGTGAKLRGLEAILRGMGRVLVAFSGGVDSALLLKVAATVLGENVLAVIAGSETYPEREVRAAERLAGKMGVRHRTIRTHELDNPEFAKNPPLRCYYCKRELFSALKRIAGEEGILYVLDGQNADDSADFRPGAKAGRELGVRSPLQEAGLTKDEIRRLSRSLGLATWNKPSLACLASRFPYYSEIDADNLRRVGAAEESLRKLGFGQLRVRHHGEVARIEISPEEFRRALVPAVRTKIVSRLKKLGYLYVTLDLAGYRTGSLNAALKKKAGSLK